MEIGFAVFFFKSKLLHLCQALVLSQNGLSSQFSHVRQSTIALMPKIYIASISVCVIYMCPCVHYMDPCCVI